MGDALVQIYLHCVWSTWDRLPLISQDIEKGIYKSILEKCKEKGCIVIALGGTPNHLHLVVRFPSTISVADFIKEIKGSSSHLVTHQLRPNEFFKWQGSYAVFSVSEKDLRRIKSYVEHQKEHHDDDHLEVGLEPMEQNSDLVEE
jgi:putative transposase